jgi:hypothetical protein
MHIALHGTFGSELARLRAADLRDRRSRDGRRRHTRTTFPRGTDG